MHSLCLCSFFLSDISTCYTLLSTEGAKTVSFPILSNLQCLTSNSIIRIIFMIPVFAIISFVSVIWYDGADWLKPIEDVYEAFALASFFLLLCAFVQEDDNERQAFFHTSGTMKQYTAATIGCFQFPVVMLIVLIVTEVTQATGKYCKTSNNVHFAHIWCTILMVISTVVAISSLLRFYKALKPTIHHRKPLPKLIGFKVIVFLSFIQNVIPS